MVNPTGIQLACKQVCTYRVLHELLHLGEREDVVPVGVHQREHLGSCLPLLIADNDSMDCEWAVCGVGVCLLDNAEIGWCESSLCVCVCVCVCVEVEVWRFECGYVLSVGVRVDVRVGHVLSPWLRVWVGSGSVTSLECKHAT